MYNYDGFFWEAFFKEVFQKAFLGDFFTDGFISVFQVSSGVASVKYCW